jgi:hypothetical protein
LLLVVVVATCKISVSLPALGEVLAVSCRAPQVLTLQITQLRSAQAA